MQAGTTPVLRFVADVYASTRRLLVPLAAVIAGRRVLVVGSAPAPILPSPQAGDVVVAVNGGISSVTDRPVDVLVTNGRRYDTGPYTDPVLWPAERRRWHEVMLAQAAGRRVGHLVLFLRDDTDEQTTERLRGQGTTWGAETRIDASERIRIAQMVGVTDLDTAFCLSSGVAAGCLARACHAADIVLCGISLHPGHAYGPIPACYATERRHRTADAVGLAVLRTHGATATARDLVPT